MRNFDTPRLFSLLLLCTLGLLVAIDRLAPFVLPPEFFFFRGWEYISGAARYNIPRTNISHTQDEYGDLSNMLGVDAFKAWRRNTYTMDSEGFRNPSHVTPEDTNVIVIGDSFMAGVGNTDDDTFAARLERELNRPVLPRVPGDLSQLLKRHQLPPVENPTVIVWGRVERNLTFDDPEISAWLSDKTCFQNPPSRIDKLKTFMKALIGNAHEYMEMSILRRIGEHVFKEMRYTLTGGHMDSVIIGNDHKNLFFAKEVSVLQRNAPNRNVDAVADAVVHAKECLRERGYSLLFLPIPDKAHIHKELVPKELPVTTPLSIDPMISLHESLTVRRIEAVDLWSIYDRHSKDDSLYWRDDTHWNPKGIRLAAQAVAKFFGN